MPAIPTGGFSLAALCLVPALGFGGSDTAVHYRGEIQAATNATGKVVAVLDRAAKEHPPDGIADEVFILRQEPSSAVDVTLPPTFAQVVFSGRSVRIMPAEGEALLLTLDEMAGDEGTRVVNGYGLIHLSAFEDSALAILQGYLTDQPHPSAFSDGGSQAKCPDGGGGVFCDAGGCSAASCSVTGCPPYPTGCEVTCTPGNFACCQCSLLGGTAHCDCWDQGTYCNC